MNFCTKSYVLSHGKQPRGRGFWAFEFHQRAPGGIFRQAPVFAPGPLSLPEAKAWATRQAAAFDVVTIVVLP